MTPEVWDADEAIVSQRDSEEDTAELASLWRYGVTGWEATHAEPLEVALSQEQPDVADEDVDEQWSDYNSESEAFPGRLVADEGVRDDDYAVAIEDSDKFAPEELAMHVVEP